MTPMSLNTGASYMHSHSHMCVGTECCSHKSYDVWTTWPPMGTEDEVPPKFSSLALLHPPLSRHVAVVGAERRRRRMLQTNAGEEAFAVEAASAAGAKEGSMWTLVHKQCSGSKAPC